MSAASTEMASILAEANHVLAELHERAIKAIQASGPNSLILSRHLQRSLANRVQELDSLADLADQEQQRLDRQAKQREKLSLGSPAKETAPRAIGDAPRDGTR